MWCLILMAPDWDSLPRLRMDGFDDAASFCSLSICHSFDLIW